MSKELNHFGVIASLFWQIGGHSSDRTNIRFDRTVWPNFYCGPNDRTFFAEHRTFYVLYSMPVVSFHTFDLLNDPHVHSGIVGLKVK